MWFNVEEQDHYEYYENLIGFQAYSIAYDSQSKYLFIQGTNQHHYEVQIFKVESHNLMYNKKCFSSYDYYNDVKVYQDYIIGSVFYGKDNQGENQFIIFGSIKQTSSGEIASQEVIQKGLISLTRNYHTCLYHLDIDEFITDDDNGIVYNGIVSYTIMANFIELINTSGEFIEVSERMTIDDLKQIPGETQNIGTCSILLQPLLFDDVEIIYIQESDVMTNEIMINNFDVVIDEILTDYQIIIQHKINNGQIFQQNITIKIISSCHYATISLTPSNQTVEYISGFAYQLTVIDLQSFQSQSMTWKLIVGSHCLKFRVYHIGLNLQMDVQIQLMNYSINLQVTLEEVEFIASFIDSCQQPIFSHQKQSPLAITGDDWSISPTHCGPILFTFLINDEKVETFEFASVSSNQLYIYTDKLNFRGNYQLTIIGTVLGNYSYQFQTTLQIIEFNPCSTAKLKFIEVEPIIFDISKGLTDQALISPKNKILNATIYSVQKSIVNISIPMTSDIQAIGSYIYNLSISAQFLDQYQYSNYTLIEILVQPSCSENKVLSAHSLNNSIYEYQLGEIFPDQQDITFTLKIEDACTLENLQSPTFKYLNEYAIGDQSMNIILLPFTLKPQCNGITVNQTVSISRQDQSESSIEFIKFNPDISSIFIFSEKSDHIGKYIVRVKGQINFQQLTITPTENDQGQYQFDIAIIDTITGLILSQTQIRLMIYQKEEVLSIKQQELKQYFVESANEIIVNGLKIQKKKLTGKIKAKIDNIDQSGVITLNFDSNLLKPKIIQPLVYFEAFSFSIFDQRNEKMIELKQTSKSQIRILSATETQNYTPEQTSAYNISQFKDNIVQIQIDFPDPINISQSQVAATKALQALAVTASTALTGAIGSNIFLSLVLGLSLKKLWMLIQTLQIIVHLPLLQIPLPSNVIFCFSSIIDISNMNIIPKKYIKDILGVFMKDQKNGIQENFKVMDIFVNSDQQIQLLFAIIMVIYLTSIIVLIIAFFRKYQLKLQEQQVKDSNLEIISNSLSNVASLSQSIFTDICDFNQALRKKARLHF
ncbi:UNKNOWN [Stylonychia lemnae]|uniref:Uncharacterized protein n=1 Tax=Stylonychia lemnae TaxID=5949 RepID=A0A077ZXY1_STYLE|nr:UNKNOWN [Stylonychia lemnae]|eukprot:CDW74457.1 UNKNOWN [Stylonychia lemnae]